jgi:GntR family transcriptional regulator/MocR family aminotransferase
VIGSNQLWRECYGHYDTNVRKVASGFAPVISVHRKGQTPLHRQIYDGYRTQIVDRYLRTGQRVPSSRALASALGISRIPVLNAYAQLLAEGYFESRSGSGTFVSSSLPESLMSCEYRGEEPAKVRTGSRLVSRRCALLPRFEPPPWLYGRGAFSVGQVALEQFPFHVWSNLMARHCRSARASSLHFSNPMGLEGFRETIAAYLRTARAVTCEAEQIMIVSGSQQALEISARVLLDPGNPVWIEEPSYRLTRHVLAMAGCRLVPVPVDGEGLDVSAGIMRCRKARAAYVTPSHQFPLGVTMSASRRLQLLDWAQSSGAWVIEDDYDSEYRYEDLPIASLQGLDRGSRVIYIGTFSKTLFPSLRAGYMVIPPDLINRFVSVRLAMDVYPPYFNQAVLNDFMLEGHFSRHIRRTRLLYRERRRVLVEAIQKESPLEVPGGNAGQHLVVMLPKGLHDRECAERAAQQGLWLWPLSPFYLSKGARQGFVLGFGSTTADKIPAAVRRLRSVLASK